MANPFNELVKLGQQLERLGSSLIVSGPSRVARRTIKELQQEGPSWTGRFSNSYQIETPDGRVYKGDGQPGEPRPIKLPVALYSGPQNLRASLPIKDRAVTTISNFSEYAAEATDVAQSTFFTVQRKSQLQHWVKENCEEVTVAVLDLKAILMLKTGVKTGTSMQLPSYRGVIGGGPEERESSATADIDWLADYVERWKIGSFCQIRNG